MPKILTIFASPQKKTPLKKLKKSYFLKK